MATPLQREALTYANQLLRGNRYRARILKAMTEAGFVESNFRNLPSSQSDRDSAGFLQQRPSQGWGTERQVRNTKYAVRQFVSRAKPIAARHGKAGNLAQAVQRSAYPQRYNQRAGDAQRLIREVVGKGGGGGGSGGGGGGTDGIVLPGTSGLSGGIPTAARGSTAAADALVASLQKPPPPPMGAIPTPAIITGPVMPRVRGIVTPSAPSFGAPAPKSDVQDVIRAASALRREAPASQADLPGSPGIAIPGVAGSDGGGGGSLSGGKRGKVVGKPRDRAGVRTNRRVVAFVERTAGVLGRPITLGTGTAHSRMTASGNVSDHWGGNALDLPASGKALTQLGHALLIAAGWSPARARKAKGGIYNVTVGGRRAQIIFNAADHYDHAHIGLK